MKLIFGHKNPDTDTISSAIIMEDYLKQLGVDAQARRLGAISNETKFVLDYINIQAPELLQSVDKEQAVVLVDHNEFGQSVDGIEDAVIEMVVDHHRVGNFQTVSPLSMRLEPVGCTTTILYSMYKEKGLVISKSIAMLMMSAIISDTLLLKSPTTTEQDVKVIEQLSSEFSIDFEAYGMEMLKAGTDLSDKTAEELLTIDAKQFSVNEKMYEVAQVSTVDIDGLLEVKEAQLVEAIKATIAKNSLDLYILLVTDIINLNSMTIVYGNLESEFEEKFNATLVDNKVLLPGVVSRKKQVVPFL